MLSSSARTAVFRGLFVVALVFALTMALLPHPPHLIIDRWGDKAQHMLVFATLAGLGGLAFPEMPLTRLGERLSFLGAMIEVCQAMPIIHRDCDIRDWIADTLAIAIVLTLLTVAGVRRRDA